MIVIVDSNEQATSRRTMKEIEKVFPKFMVSKLASGDINVILDDGSILAVERKEIHDFLGSIADGRVFKQVENMASSAKYYAIVIEGSLQINYDSDMVVADGEITNWKGASVRAALFSIMWSGCPVSFAPKGCYAETVEEMVKIVSKNDEHFQKQHRRIITFPPIEIEQDILMAFPNIGFTRAESLLGYVGAANKGKQIGLAEALCWASMLNRIEKDGRPKGWGNAIIEDFRKTLGLEDGEYLDIRKEEGNEQNH